MRRTFATAHARFRGAQSVAARPITSMKQAMHGLTTRPAGQWRACSSTSTVRWRRPSIFITPPSMRSLRRRAAALTTRPFCGTSPDRRTTPSWRSSFRTPAIAERQRLAEQKEASFRSLAASGGVDVTPGAAAMLAWARRRHVATGLVTNAPRANAEMMIAVLGLAAAFDVVVSADDIARGKPHPDPYLAAMDTLGLPRSRPWRSRIRSPALPRPAPRASA